MNKLKITYWMLRGKETAETYIELPISEDRYHELHNNLEKGNDNYEKIKGVLERLVYLQRYDELGGFMVETEVDNEQ